MTEILGIQIWRLAHACFRIQAANGKIIYLDPFKVSQEYNDANIVCITHQHYDHCSKEDIKKLINPETIIICPPDCQNKLSGLTFKDMKLVKPGMKFSIEGIQIKTVPAYNTNKQFHLKEQEWVGYIINTDGKWIYHCGDSDFIPEMRQLKNIDIALLAVSGTYVMTAEEAANAANVFKPKVAVPMHYGAIIGTKEDAERFKGKFQGVTEII